jgi:hemerythrin superfamily protein
MPDPISMLEQDHRKVETLFAEWQRTKDGTVAEQICTELTIHATVEEQAVYPVLAQDVPQGEALEEEAEQEHGEAKEMIAKIQQAGYTGPRVAEYMEELISGVNHHVEEEEGEIFPKLRKAIPKDKLDAIGVQVQQVKAQEMAALTGRSMATTSATTSAASSAAASKDQLIDLTKDELYKMAQEKGVAGRSDMDKTQLIEALSHS